MSQSTLANLLSSYTVDMGLAKREDPSLLADHSKVSREVQSQMARVTANAEEWMRTSGIDAVQFDAKDEVAKAWGTLDDGTKIIIHIKENHITPTDAESGGSERRSCCSHQNHHIPQTLCHRRHSQADRSQINQHEHGMKGGEYRYPGKATWQKAGLKHLLASH